MSQSDSDRLDKLETGLKDLNNGCAEIKKKMGEIEGSLTVISKLLLKIQLQLGVIKASPAVITKAIGQSSTGGQLTVETPQNEGATTTTCPTVDSRSSVQNLTPLVKKTGKQVLEMTDNLCDKLQYGEEQNRDVAGVALKKIVAEVPVAQSLFVTNAPQLKRRITHQKVTEIKGECLDNLCEVLHKYDDLMASEHMVLWGANQARVRKKGVSCDAHLASCFSHDLLAKATGEIVHLLKNQSAKPEFTCINIQMIGALNRVAECSVGPNFGDAIFILINCCNNQKMMKNVAMQALESFLHTWPGDIAFYCEQILHVTLEFLSHDPNFTDKVEGNTDDGDEVWKVGRAAAKCLAAIIISQLERLSRLYKEAGLKWIDRFEAM